MYFGSKPYYGSESMKAMKACPRTNAGQVSAVNPIKISPIDKPVAASSASTVTKHKAE
jgi:hypothetical protein